MSDGGDDELHEEHEEHVNHEAWVIPYADLLTLLMAMFIALFAMSTVDVSKFKAFAVGFNEALGGGKLDSGIGGAGKATSPVVGSANGQGVFTGTQLLTGGEQGTTTNDLNRAVAALLANKQGNAEQKQTLDEVKQDIDAAAKALGLEGKVQTKQLNEGLDVTLLTDKVLFSSGSAVLQSGADPLLAAIADVLGRIDNNVVVQGHTDTDQIHTAQYPSNRYLSSARADAVVEFLIDHGILSSRLTSAGKGSDVPIASNATAAGKAANRRVEIIVQSNQVKQVLDQNGLDDEEAPTSTPTTAGVPVGPPSKSVDPGVKPNLGGGSG